MLQGLTETTTTNVTQNSVPKVGVSVWRVGSHSLRMRRDELPAVQALSSCFVLNAKTKTQQRQLCETACSILRSNKLCERQTHRTVVQHSYELSKLARKDIEFKRPATLRSYKKRMLG